MALKTTHAGVLALGLASVACFAPAAARGQTAEATEPPADDAAPEVTGAPADAADDAGPDAATRAEYQRVVGEAVSEFAAGRWAEARAGFMRGHELWPSARTFRTLGMTSFELRAYPRALRELRAALSDPRRPLSLERRAEVEALIGRTRGYVGSFRIALSPPDATLLVDGKPWQPDADATLVLGVGSHEFVARAPGHREARRDLLVQGREDGTLELTLSPVAATAPSVADAGAAPRPDDAALTASTPAAPEPDVGGRFYTWVAAGGAVALGAGSAALWLAADAEFEDLRDICDARRDTAEPCTGSDPGTGRYDGLELAHKITLGLSLTAAVGAIVLYFVEAPDESNLGLVLTPDGPGLQGRF